MKISLLICSFIFSTACFASSSDLHTQPARRIWPHFKNPFKEKHLYSKGHGTLGLIAGITLGPIGYYGTRLLSHNQIMRDKSKTGFAIWFVVVVIGVLTWQAIEAKISLDDTLNFLGQIILQALFSS